MSRTERRRSTSRRARSAPPVLEPGRSRSRRSAPPTARGQSPKRGAAYLRSGRGRRPRRLAGGSITVALALLVVGGLTAFVLTRPASAMVTATPADASISFAGIEASGTVTVEELDPGIYELRIERKGFETVVESVELKRGKREKREYDLEPLLMPVTLITHPEGAKCTITCADGTTFEGTSPFESEVPAGDITISVASTGYNPFSRTLFLDERFSLDYFLDPEGQAVHGLGTITTVGAPKGVSITPDGSEAWASILDGPPSIEIFDPRTGARLGGVDLGTHGAVEVIFNKAGTLAYTSQMETAKCFEIDVKTRKVLREFDTKSAWTKWVTLAPDERTLYASNWSGDDVSEIDLATGQLERRFRVSNTPRGMYAPADGKYLFVAGFDSGKLDRVDLATGKVEAVFTGGTALRHIVGDVSSGRLFISDMAKDLIYAYDLATGKTSVFAKVNHKPNTIDLSPDGKVLFVSCRGANNPKSYYIPGPEWGTVLLFDTVTGKPLDAIIGGNQPTALDVSDDGRLLVFSDFLDNRLRVYEVPPYETLVKGNGGRYEAHFAEIKK